MPTLRQRLARIAPYFRSSRKGFVAAIAAAVVGAATEPMIPALLQPLLDRGFSAGGIPLWTIPVAIIGLFLVRGGAAFVTQYALSWATTRGVLELRQAMFAHLMRAAPALFTRQSASSLTNTLVYEVQQGAQQLVNASLTLLRDSLTLLALLGYLLWLNWKLTLFVAVLAPAIVFVIRTVSRRLHRLTRAVLSANDELAYVVEENALAWRIVRLHGAAAEQSGRFARASEQLRRLTVKSVAAGATMSPITQLLAACALSAVIALALWQSRDGGVTVGSFVAFVTAMLMMLSPIKHLSDVAAPITRGLAALERGVALLDDHPRERGGTHAPASGRVRGEIELRGVSLRYADDQPCALDDVDLVLHAGETVALVGPSGAGKSTLVHLLPRFVEPTAGEVRLDGVVLPQWDTDALRRQFALVSQDVVLFNDSVAANVALGGTLDRDRVRDALRGAHLLDFVERLPQGIDSAIGHNGSQLSGGQRQRLAIARAIYKDAPVLILDEATSALDSESERAVQDALDTLMRGRTTIVIAHRLSTIEHADRVVAMEHGRIVEQGPPAALLAAGGLYARLHGLQFRS
ncbi:MAG: lipid A export permease/ATP-binding protein MsbA [Gammaproteobacteria bacterium]|uniref:lipid A export permease/ATP-binding protein MsbA n=1 Tax=Azohydromonas sp. TaxID=1872666 RepID=UPI002CFC24A2|nr:lipid A export permease/ATP-binding protein MsbA [Azohydromonas sp.]HMM84119.1 lipid A export permease/ATP-binding protein MsbA [Azohydromonas sp.]